MSNEVEWQKYVDQRFDDSDKAVQAALVSQEKAVAAALAAAEKAVNKAEDAANDRFEAANNVKATFSESLSEKLSVSEYRTAHQALIEKIDSVTARVAAIEGRSSGLNAGWGYLAAAVGLAATIIATILAFNN